MRIIDADALLEYLDKRRTYEVMNGHNKAYGKGVRDAMKDLEDAPTIAAIPVEWLEEWLTEPDARNHVECILSLWRWQKEQEVQDG